MPGREGIRPKRVVSALRVLGAHHAERDDYVRKEKQSCSPIDVYDAASSITTSVRLPRRFRPGVFAALAEVAMQFLAAQQLSSQTYAEIQSALPQRRRRSAIQLARSICLISGQPLSVPEIQQRMRKEGYSTRSKNFSEYLRRLLRESGQFDEVAPGMWSLQTA